MVGYNRILDELRRRAADAPELAETIAFYTALLSAQARAEPRHSPALLAPDARARCQAGQPILAPEAFQTDAIVFATLCHRVCLLAAAERPELATPFDAIRNWLCAEQGSLLNGVTDFLDTGCVRLGERAGLDGARLAFVFNQALHPFLRKYARALAPFVDESIWYRPNCPICGGAPDLAAFAKETGARRLLCSRCDFEWAFWRVSCPFCGCDDSEMLKCAEPDNALYRLYVCERCNGYLKTIDLRAVDGERLLPVERILTLPMDRAARQMQGVVAPHATSVLL